MALTVTHVFMVTELRRGNKIYVIFHFARRYGQWSSTATAEGVTAISRTVEGHIRVASSIQEHKNGPFNTKADIQ